MPASPHPAVQSASPAVDIAEYALGWVWWGFTAAVVTTATVWWNRRSRDRRLLLPTLGGRR